MEDNVVDERLRLERLIKNDIQNPRLKEGLLKRYLDYDEIAEGLPSNIKDELLIYTNKEVINDIHIFGDLRPTDLTESEKEGIEQSFFDWEEPTPIEDAFLAEMEGWDIDAQGNPINPSNKPEGMSKFQQELINEYNYILENGKTSAKLSRSYLKDLLKDRPDGQSVEEFIKANNFTQEEIGIIKYETGLDTGEYVNTGDYIDEDLADGDMMNAQYDSEIEIPDTVPEDLVEEVDRERFREFLELQEPEGTVLYDDAEIAEQAEENTRSRLTPQESDEFVDIAKNEELPTYEDVVNQYNQQLDNVVDNIPIEKIAKKKLKDKVLELSTRLLTPGGAMDLVDAYETIVFGLGMIVAAAPELKGIASYYSTLAANHIGKAYGMNIPVDKLEPDWERINKVMDQVEAVTPTDILINKVMDREQKSNTYVSSYLPGFLPQSTIKNDDVSTTLEKTLMNMPINKGKTETSSDKLKESLIYGSTK